MPSVIFVDDEVNVIRGLQRMLWAERQNWKMEFVTSGTDALEKMEKDDFEVLITDMRMLGMDGAELMAHVAVQHPDVVRIVLSGQSDRTQVMRSIGLAHQFLSKPCQASTLKGVLQRSFDMQALITDPRLRKIALQADVVPVIPTLYEELSRVLRDPNKGSVDAAKLVEQDPGMTARILQLANSAFFGLSREVCSIEQAVRMLGIETVKHLVFAIQVFSQFDKVSRLLAEEITNHCFLVGHLSKIIAKSIQPNYAEESFLAGVLHDVGRLMLLANFPVMLKYSDEFEQYGCNHAQLGGYLLGNWGLPVGVVEAVSYHHEPELSKVHDFTPLTAVYIADRLIRKEEIDPTWLKERNLEGHIPVWKAMADV